jgi:hypothetical protein
MIPALMMEAAWLSDVSTLLPDCMVLHPQKTVVCTCQWLAKYVNQDCLRACTMLTIISLCLH